MKEILKKLDILIFVFLIICLFVANVIRFNWIGLTLSLIILVIFLRCKKEKRKNFLIGFSIIAILVFLIIRVFLIYNLDFTLSSDFKLYYDSAVRLASGVPFADADYLSYNGYVVVFSSVLALFFKIFGASVRSALWFNLLCQAGTCVFLYKILRKYNSREKSFILTAIWFIMPMTMWANMLISTENLFLLLFTGLIYFYLKIKDKNFCPGKIILFLLLGLLGALCNNIRPVMVIFIIALIITTILSSKRLTDYVLTGAVIISFMLGNVAFNSYTESKLGIETQSGALAWSIYFGSNYDTRGQWNLKDSKTVGEVLKSEDGDKELIRLTIDRYKEMGIKIPILFGKKFYYLWTDLNANEDFVNSVIVGNTEPYRKISEVLNYSFVIILAVCLVVTTSKRIKNGNYDFLLWETFSIGYILSNLLVVLNGRYNYPLFIMCIILCSSDGKDSDNMVSCYRRLGSEHDMKEKLTKLVNVYKKYGFIGFCKKCYAYVVANYLNKFSLDVLFRPKKYRLMIREILDDCKYDRIVLWRSSFGYQHPLWQRPQHISNNLRKNGCLVFYEVTTMTDKVKTLRKESDNLYLFNYTNIKLNKILMEELEQVKMPKYIQLYCTDWKLSVQNIEDYISCGFKFIYEYIDDLSPDLAGTKELPRSIQEKYNYVMEHDEVYVAVSARKLEEDVINKRGKKNVVFSTNGVDYAFFEKYDEDYVFEPEFQEILDKKKPIVMYYGALARWFDYDLIKRIDALGKYSIVLFGIKYDDAFDESGIEKLENVYFLGSRDYKVLKNYAKCADILTIPFKINRITEATSPVKIFEYMALHKPIVITDLAECRQYKSVMIAHDHDEFIRLLDMYEEKKNDKKYIELLDKEARENDWSYKAKAIVDMIKRDE